jgi:hypothetical protein
VVEKKEEKKKEEEEEEGQAAEGAWTVMEIVMEGAIHTWAEMVLKYWAAHRVACREWVYLFGCQAVYRDTFYTSPRTAPAFVMS